MTLDLAISLFLGALNGLVAIAAGVSVAYQTGAGPLRFGRIAFRVALMISGLAIALSELLGLWQNPLVSRLCDYLLDYAYGAVHGAHFPGFVLTVMLFPLIEGLILLIGLAKGYFRLRDLIPWGVDAALAFSHILSVAVMAIPMLFATE
jgi:hypothetical protein